MRRGGTNRPPSDEGPNAAETVSACAPPGWRSAESGRGGRPVRYQPSRVAIPIRRKEADHQLFRRSTELCVRDFFVGKYSRGAQNFSFRTHRPPSACQLVQQTEQRKTANKMVVLLCFLPVSNGGIRDTQDIVGVSH